MFKTRLYVALIGMVCLISCCLMLGCLGGGSSTGISAVKNVFGGEKSYLRVSLDGMEAKQNTLKKAATGHSNWDIKEQVSGDNLKLSYKITNPEKLGRITFTNVSIYQEFKGNYSTQPEFVVFGCDNRPASLMKENVMYDLGNPPASLKVIDVNGQKVKGVKLVPGMKYMLQLTIKADKSETACVYFKAK